MFTCPKLGKTAIVLLIAAAGLAPTGASAVTVEVAKKCSALMEKEFPPRQSGNPAAGSAKGSSQVQRDYFNKCVTNGGNVDATPEKSSK